MGYTLGFSAMNALILSHNPFGALGEEICPSMVISAEGPISWTNLTDSDSRFSRFIRAITSFRCNSSWRPMQYVLVFKKTKNYACSPISQSGISCFLKVKIKIKLYISCIHVTILEVSILVKFIDAIVGTFVSDKMWQAS